MSEILQQAVVDFAVLLRVPDICFGTSVEEQNLVTGTANICYHGPPFAAVQDTGHTTATHPCTAQQQDGYLEGGEPAGSIFRHTGHTRHGRITGTCYWYEHCCTGEHAVVFRTHDELICNMSPLLMLISTSSPDYLEQCFLYMWLKVLPLWTEM